MAETEWHESLRYLGYTVGIFAGTVAVALVLLFLGEVIAFLVGIIHLMAFVALALEIALPEITRGIRKLGEEGKSGIIYYGYKFKLIE